MIKTNEEVVRVFRDSNPRCTLLNGRLFVDMDDSIEFLCYSLTERTKAIREMVEDCGHQQDDDSI